MFDHLLIIFDINFFLFRSCLELWIQWRKRVREGFYCGAAAPVN
jgi:hypothetical protein